MLSNHQSNLLAKVLAWGSFIVTIGVYNGAGFDPVNLPKQFALVIWAGFCLGIWVSSAKSISHHLSKPLVTISGVFILGLVFSTFASSSPFVINFYGTPGRNTGFLTYLSLLIVAISAALLKSRHQVILVIKFFLGSVFFNLIYGIYVTLTKKDPFPWSNPYGNFLGTLGNPDFISAFLGIGFAVTLSLILIRNYSNWFRIVLGLTLFIDLVLIKGTHALQGIMVAALGTVIVLAFYVKYNLGNKLLSLYSVFCGSLGLMVVLGMLQIGPLTRFVYKTSVSIRGEYWHAGFNMFKHSPIWGIGLDSYGDYFRRFREISSITLPGVNVVTDSAHNVFIDILAGGGLLLFVPYLIIQVIVAYRIMSRIKLSDEFDPILVSLSVGWICYLAQSLISINQIGLAIWGWLFAGLILAYTNNSSQAPQVINANIRQKNRIQTSNELSAGNFISVATSILVATILISPPFLKEHSWRKSLSSNKIEKIISATNAWPKSNQRYIQTSQMFLKSNLGNETIALVRDGIKFDPDFRDYWFFLYNLTSSQSEKALALENLKRLDPLNPEYK